MWNITNYSNTHGKPCKYYESQHDQLKTWSTRNPTNCAAITTRLWAGTDEHNVLQSLREAPALVNFNLDTEKTSQRDEPEMTSSRGSPKKGVGWTHHGRLRLKRSEHEENAEREKHEQTVIMKSNSGWKTFWRTTAMRERSRLEPPHHFTKKTANSNAQTLHARTHSDQPCKMIQPSHHPHMTKKHVFPIVSQHDMKHGSTWWTRPLPQISTYCASVTTLDCTSTNNNWQTLCCT